MATRKQYFDIKFPFTCNNLDEFFIDLNAKEEDKVASEILHVLLTPKKTRIRMPDFGTGLIKYIFEPSDEDTWENTVSEARKSVARYVKDVEITNIQVLTDENNEHRCILDIKYRVSKGKTVEEHEIVAKI